MTKMAFPLALLVSATPAAAEDWWHSGTDGNSPDREVGMVDRESLDRTDPDFPRVTLALLKERPDRFGVTQIVSTQQFDCAEGAVKTTYIELRDETGASLGSQRMDDEYDAIPSDSRFEQMRIAACSGQWLWPDDAQYGEGKTLLEVQEETFGG